MSCGNENNSRGREIESSAFPVMPDGKPAPGLMTEAEAIRYLRLGEEGPSRPELTLRYYRERGLLKGTRVGRRIRYRRVELDRFLARITEPE